MEVDEETFPSKKKIHVNAASLVDLKAALYRKQQEARNSALGGNLSTSKTTQNKRISDKTASIWRRDPKKPQKGAQSKGGRNSAPSSSSSKLTPEEEATLAKSRAALEAKAKLYDRLAAGSDDSDDDDDDDPRYMVDFQKKLVQLNKDKKGSIQTSSAASDKKEEKKDEEVKAENSDEEWVEYVDSLGRSRRCMKKDLSEMQRLDKEMESARNTKRDKSRSPTPELLSADMRQERERVEWERNAFRETGGHDEPEEIKPVGPVHYQNVQHNEVRSHGVGYYSFSVEEEKRQAQLKTLNQLRDDTIDKRAKREQLKAKRQAILEAKLARVRQRKLKQGGGDDGGKPAIDIADFDFESREKKMKEKETKDADSLQVKLANEVAKARERAEEDERAKHVRPWDRGKVIDPIRKRKQELREERPCEFAPPTSYKKLKDTTTWTHPPPPPPPPPPTEEADNSNNQPLYPYPPYPPPPTLQGGVMYIPQFVPTFMYPPPPPPPPS
ncbi:PREDICTED: coiled-coil domain-containing protein 174-like [Amphimedon queenslandica]|uniref:CCDC174 alpha/beta GRSR domain-containing protein n=2 Tax=Amphimedon queenslandica TaxID=400682 RepID=A0AAN0IZA9_AMPQE|nr:PREDICTED: coiled-coil domain-containing protein 174-like [Amphimedon queenslandica]|eukprot:XP_019850109.1 PREDICTED: coiled-coil domain-containing protein 174-like [Amphimedon queenslandica]